MYVYIQSELGLYTVGFYDPSGKWHADSDCDSRDEASERVAYLNGSRTVEKVKEVAVDMPDELSATQVADACLTFDHAFGLLPQEEKDRLLLDCRHWYHAIRRAILDPVPDPAIEERLPDG